MNFESFKKLLSKIQHLDLPAEKSHIKMMPPYRNELVANHKEPLHTARKAAVLALFYPDEFNETKLVLILRKTYKGVHSAQVGFPGGKVEKEDKSLADTALRETFEEVGVALNNMVIVKALTKVYIPPSHYNVYPFIGYCLQTPILKKQDEEVEAILEVDFNHFLDDSNLKSKKVKPEQLKEFDVPALELNNHLVWGATAMMLSEVKDLIKTVL
ncbi:NUDIX hydrolase [Aurantibacter aestuarii]|uniref:Coenzyme A pyrophosphatase n=1 Tax=Aurantibacter aestuarii TaxID=1266046 RepID=A0A2T1N594_9FLAO|nr:CoA pyrophosphatase [Aurantibacter aestuarii]PSG86435.1 coenzyme A pyrophosphatase [Aurantibacter aestuarii]